MANVEEFTAKGLNFMLQKEVNQALSKFSAEEKNLESEVLALVYPDGRGEGYGLRKFNDSPLLDFSQIEKEPDVHFAHARGFIAKTSATEKSRLLELLAAALVN